MHVPVGDKKYIFDNKTATYIAQDNIYVAKYHQSFVKFVGHDTLIFGNNKVSCGRFHGDIINTNIEVEEINTNDGIEPNFSAELICYYDKPNGIILQRDNNHYMFLRGVKGVSLKNKRLTIKLENKKVIFNYNPHGVGNLPMDHEINMLQVNHRTGDLIIYNHAYCFGIYCISIIEILASKTIVDR